MDTLGIDIGTVSVKYVRVRGKGNKGAVISTGVYPYAGELSQLEHVLSDIRVKEGGLRVAIGISSPDILKKSLAIPVLPKEEVREALNWSISKTLVLPLDEMFHDYIMLGEVEERGARKEEACFVGVQKAFVNNFLATFRKSGFKNVVLFTDIGLAYGEVIGDEKDGPVAVIDVGGTQSGIYVFEGNNLKLVREILIAAESFSDALIDGLNVQSRETAAFIEVGFREGTVELSASSFDKFAEEVQRTFTAFAKRSPDRPVKKIYIAGRGSKIPFFVQRLRTYFGEGVELLCSTREFEPEFLPAFLLATHHDKLVNLLPEDIKAGAQEAHYRKWFALGSAGVAAVLAIFSLNMLVRLNSLNVALAGERAGVARMREKVRMLSIATTSTKHNDLMPFINEIEKKDKTVVVLLKYLSSQLPKEISLKEIHFGPEKPVSSGPGLTAKEAISPESGLSDPARSGPGSKQNVPNSPTQQGGAPPAEKDPWLVVSGFVFGEVDVADPALLGLVIKLGDTGIVHNVEVTRKEVKVMKGKRVIEFTIAGRCIPYEV
jgi:type IV pilus assembly protein PilM